ncbi:ABC transporter ATP-binding protein [Diaphorobacter nitroreducens]|jgi:NitT/TauT family transport system ATP-binding protein/sulfonate transport system ATP-binding protein|uniref:ABC transporter ATP-binding protein n=1 Tax=Diaphorobacter nitroreducens TaxID=164759 RepID=UPI0028A20806|nr:ABC transporter ATP-binding protein [Diaphorobacter nitroreducens]
MSDPISKNRSVPILSIQDLDKVFHLNGNPIHALKNVNLQIQKGEFICLIGASGCGKSTLLRIIGGFEQATSGVARLYHAPIQEPGSERGMVFQDYGLFPWLTVRQNIAFGPKQRGLPAARLREISDHYLDMVGLTRFADHFPSQLSGGMKQRVSIARVLANDCDVLLMDEPFGALDALTREVLQQELLNIWEKTKLTVIFVTHAVEEAVLLADRVVVMTAGPGRVERDYTIPLERPRRITAPEFNAVRQELTDMLSSHVSHAKAA